MREQAREQSRIEALRARREKQVRIKEEQDTEAAVTTAQRRVSVIWKMETNIFVNKLW